MYLEKLKEFKEFNEKFETRLQELQRDRDDIYEKLEIERYSYAKALADDVKQSDRKKQSEMSRIRRNIESLGRHVSDIDDRIDYTKKARYEHLVTILPNIKGACVSDIDMQVTNIKDVELEILRRKCEYLAIFADVFQYKSEAGGIHQSFLNEAHSLDNHEYDKPYLSLPTLNLASNYMGGAALPPLMPQLQEVQDAIQQGKLPAYVQYYKKTGLVLPDNDARDKLDEMKRKGAGKNEQ